MKSYIITGIGVAIGLVGSWLAGYVASDTGWDRMILRVALALIVLIGGAMILWFLLRKNKPPNPTPELQPELQDELEIVLREGAAKLASARLQTGDRFGSYPVFFVIGPPGSAKTTAIIESGLEPELLAGQLYQDTKIASTASANIWYARESIFVECGAKLLGDPAIWSRLLRRFEPGKLKSFVKRGAQPLRAIVTCYDVESLLRQPLETNLNEARTMRARLSECSQALGISVPVYVLFTRLDRAAFFQDYVKGFDEGETAQVFGAALPFRLTSRGVYSEEQTNGLNQCFQQLFYSLCNKRPELLARETNPERAPDVYEFPREFRKLRAMVVPFLVELCRPSQLTIGPYLRGFYFSGVRPVLVREIVASPAARSGSAPSSQADANATRADANATRMFRPGDLASAQVRPEISAGEATTRRVPQWMFLKSFFRDVLLADRAVSGLSGTSTRTHTWRRVALGSVAVACTVLSCAFVGSFIGNRNMGSRSLSAATAIASHEALDRELPSIDALNRLETLRQSLERLTGYQLNGAPMSLGWGLYTGDKLYPQVSKLYFDRFQQLLLLPVQRLWVADMRKLPSTAGPNENGDGAYNSLRAYLITTSNHEYSTRKFLSPQLSARWAQGLSPGDRLAIATRQFDFYSDQLKGQNPFPAGNDPVAVRQARNYIRCFGDLERVYRFMIVEANKLNEKVNFNDNFKGSEEIVLNNRDVFGAYTKGGWATMQNSIRNSDTYRNGEEWVLGSDTSAKKADQDKLAGQLRARYSGEFVTQWRDYLRRSEVKKFDVKNAVGKLSVIASAQSPLLQMFWLASQNTAVDSPDIQSAFKALHSVLPSEATRDQMVVSNNESYMKALSKLGISLDKALKSPSNESTSNQTLAEAADARLLVDQMALSYGPDPNDTIKKLLKAPITNVESVLMGDPAGEMNAKGAGLCKEMSQLSSKYPFSSKAKTTAGLEDLNAVFQPKQGILWKFYDENLRTLLVLNNDSHYVPVPGATVQLDPRFVDFFNRAAAFSRALYPGGAPEPHLVYKLKSIKIEGIDSIYLEIDGQPVTYNGGEATPVALTWPGPGKAAVKASITPANTWFDKQGLWSTFQFFSEADEFRPHFKWYVDVRVGRSGRSSETAGKRYVSLDLDMGAGPPVFQKGYLTSMGCVATTVAK